MLLKKGSRTPSNLTPNFFAAADPRISFDGSTVLFAGKKDAASAWQIWEMKTDGTGLRQVSHRDGDCLSPAWLPRDEIAFTGETGDGRASQIYVSNRDGSNAHLITFGPGGYELETVLENGMLLVSARTPLLSGDGPRNLYTIRPDGSGLASFRCDHKQEVIRSQAEELDDGAVVFVRNSVRSAEAGGELAEIERGATHNSILAPGSTLIWSPRQLETKKLILARRAAARGSSAKFDLYVYDFAQARFEGPVYRDPALSSVEAAPVAAHAVPRWYWSTLKPNAPAGYFICLDAARSADAPGGKLQCKPAKVRVLMLDAAAKQEYSLGEAPIEEDGSFYIAVPPDSPVRFELLDGAGKTIHAQQSWIWARPAEEHGCVGCHEDRALAPPNHWPMALRRFDAPLPLGVKLQPAAAH